MRLVQPAALAGGQAAMTIAILSTLICVFYAVQLIEALSS
jgi:hypothetical protein